MVRFSNKQTSISWLTTLLLAAFLGGCRVRHLPAPIPPLPLPGTYAGQSDTSTIGEKPYRNLFTDTYLVALVDTALNRNPDLRIALQRIEAARGVFGIQQGALLPQVDAVASVGVDRYGRYTLNGVGNFDTNFSPNISSEQRIPNPTPDYFLGLRTTWELDLWGKLRNRRRAAFLRLLASQEGRNLVVTSLIADVAGLYYTLLALDGELEIIGENIELQQQALNLVEVQKAAGRVTELAVQQFRAQLLDTRSREGQIQQEIVQTENRLNYLLGRYPQPIARGASIEKQSLPPGIRAGVPVQLLRRRPDVRQAERELEAANVDVAVAQAEFWPSLRLSPYVGFNAFRPEVLLNPQSLATGVLAGLTAPVFNRRLLKGNLLIAESQSREAFYVYQRSLLNGVSEVVTSLKGLENYRNVADLKRQEVAVLRQATTTSNELFANGYATYLEVITAQRSVLETELALISTRRAQFQSLVDLYRALGGGWE